MTQRLPFGQEGRAQDLIARNLEEALARVRADIATVEIWITALSCFAQPVPPYEPDDRYLLPPALRATGSAIDDPRDKQGN
jgi:hypothetical protein